MLSGHNQSTLKTVPLMIIVVLVHCLYTGYKTIFLVSVSDELRVIESKSGQVGQSINVQGPLFVGQIHNHPALDMWRNKINLKQYTRYKHPSDMYNSLMVKIQLGAHISHPCAPLHGLTSTSN